MADAECPVCMNSFKFESMRSLQCGHTYCSSCVEQVINSHLGEDTVPKCPECRHEFESEDVRRIFITPPIGNSKSAATPSDLLEEDGFIKQATHIANRLKKINADTPAQSLRTAVDIMEHVATIQSKRAQEILWKAVREFWIDLVPYFEHSQQCKALPFEISSLKERVAELGRKFAARELEAEIEHKQWQQDSKSLQVKDEEIAQLKMILRNAHERTTEERERYRVLLARHSASETKYRAQIKQLKKELKARERESVTGQTQFEEESLIIEQYGGAGSHRLDIYNDAEGSHQHRELSPEESARAQHSGEHFSADELDSLSSFQPEPPETQERGRGRAKRSHRTVESSSPPSSPSLRRPRFGSDWNLPRLHPRRKLVAESESIPLQLDSRGRPKGLLQCGPRVRMKAK